MTLSDVQKAEARVPVLLVISGPLEVRREREGAGSEEGLGQSCLYTCLTSDLLPVCIPAPLADTRFMTF